MTAVMTGVASLPRRRGRRIRINRQAVNRQIGRALVLLVAFVCWQVAGNSDSFARGAIPTPSEVWSSMRADWTQYVPHIEATLASASWGFVIGNAIGCAFAFLYLLLPRAASITRGLLVTLFCMPIAIVAPLLGVMLPMTTAKVVIAAVWAVFTMQVAFLLAMRQVPPGSLTVVESAGGNRAKQLALVHLRAGVPGFLAALQISAPSVLLAATLADFLGGQEGIGAYLTGLVVAGDQSRIWAFSIVIAAISAALYFAFGILRSLVTGADINIAVAETVMPVSSAGGASLTARIVRGALSALAGLALVLAVWWVFVASVDLPAYIANSPLDVFETFTGERGPTILSEIGGALAKGIPLAVIGVALGLLAALVLAVLATLAPWFTQAVMPFAMIFQSVPTVAFAPMFALIFGRGSLTILTITILVTFFPAFVSISTGLASAPEAPSLVLKSVDASPLRMLWLYAVPQAEPYVFAAARLVVPLAILGVVLAEELVTGTGIGELMAIARGYQDFPMMWCVTVVMVLISVASYLLVEALERWHLARRQQ